jgi:tetratricopeptide (TPR) repeat protein
MAAASPCVARAASSADQCFYTNGLRATEVVSICSNVLATIRTGRGRVSPLINRAVAYIQLDDISNALSDLNNAIEIDPTSIEAHQNRAVIYMRLGDTAAAREDYAAILMRRPIDAEDFVSHGIANDGLGNTSDAIQDYNIALAKHPSVTLTLFDIYTRRGLDLRHVGQNSEAVTDLQAAVQLRPQYFGAFDNLASIEYSIGDQRAAEVAFRQAAALNPRDEHAYIGLAQINYRSHNFSEALKFYQRANEVNPKNIETMNAICWTRAVSNDHPEEGVAYCNQGLASSAISTRQKISLLNSRALTLFGMHQFEDAIGDCNTSLGLLSTQPIALYIRGLARMRAGKAEEGRTDLAAATAIDPNLQRQLTQLGIAP